MTKKLTVGEILDEVNKLELKRAVFFEVDRFLSKFIRTDSHIPDVGMLSPITTGVIAEDVIEEVKDELLVRQLEYTMQIEKLKGQTTTTTKKTATRKRATVRKTTTKKKAGRRAPPKRRKSSGKKA